MGTGNSQQSHFEQLAQSYIQEVQDSLAELRCHKVTLPAYQRAHKVTKTWVSFSELPSKKYIFSSNTPIALSDYSGEKNQQWECVDHKVMLQEAGSQHLVL